MALREELFTDLAVSNDPSDRDKLVAKIIHHFSYQLNPDEILFLLTFSRGPRRAALGEVLIAHSESAYELGPLAKYCPDLMHRAWVKVSGTDRDAFLRFCSQGQRNALAA